MALDTTFSWLRGCAFTTLCAISFGNVWAQQPAAPAAEVANAIDPAVDQAMQRRFDSIFSAIEGKSKPPQPSEFTDVFNQQATPAALQQLLSGIHSTSGKCRIAGQARGPISSISSFLLQCDKGFVPIDMAIEHVAPYRIHTLMIRPGYRKM